MRLIWFFLSISLALSGCSDPFAEAQALDTVAAYDAFIEANPNSVKIDMAKIRLEELVLEDARISKSLAGYDAYLKRYPSGRFQKAALKERQDFLFDWAMDSNTVDAWKKYLDEYRKGDKKKRIKAKKRLFMAEHRDTVELGAVKMERVNLAEDPSGPLNGYGFYVDVTNKGKRPIISLNLEIAYLNAGGKALDRKWWPVVAPRLPGGLPMAEGFGKPIAPGETRTWEWSDGGLPEAWSKKVTVQPISIRFPGPK
jgi:hypothetical protein